MHAAHLDFSLVDHELGVDKLQVDELVFFFEPPFHGPRHEIRLRGVVKHRAVTRIRCY